MTDTMTAKDALPDGFVRRAGLVNDRFNALVKLMRDEGRQSWGARCAAKFEQPGDAEPIATIHHGIRFDLTGCRDDGWCSVVKGDQQGWVRRDTFRSDDVAEEPMEPETNNDDQVMATVNGDVDLYDVPGGVGTVIGMLEKDSTHTLLQCKSDNWCQVEEGWVWGDFLDHWWV
jgi:SH3-like domain-containing protein